LRTTARSLKTTLVLDAASFAGLQAPNGVPKFDIEVGGRMVTAGVAAKPVRKVAATLTEQGRCRRRHPSGPAGAGKEQLAQLSGCCAGRSEGGDDLHVAMVAHGSSRRTGVPVR
jgi:hypothetical protein